MRIFLVRFQKGLLGPNKQDKSWKEDELYPVFEIWKYAKTDKETGASQTVTKFLICNSINGEMRWVDAKNLLYAGE